MRNQHCEHYHHRRRYQFKVLGQNRCGLTKVPVNIAGAVTNRRYEMFHCIDTDYRGRQKPYVMSATEIESCWSKLVGDDELIEPNWSLTTSQKADYLHWCKFIELEEGPL